MTEEDFSTDEVVVKDGNGVTMILHLKKEKRKGGRVILTKKEIMND